MYKYILFDLDGTLTDPKEGITKCVQHALEYFNIYQPDNDKLTCFIGPPLHQSFEVFYGFDSQKAMLAVEKYRERYKTVGVFENELIDGVDNMLKRLKQEGKILAIASSKPIIFVEQILTHFNIRQYFDVVAGSNLDGSQTDKAEVIQDALAQLDIDKSDHAQTVMVGDRRHDVEGAKKCGIACIGVRFGFAEPNELETAGAVMIAENIEQLTQMLI